MTDTIKTPWHLWVVGGLMVLWNAFPAFDFSATMISGETYLGEVAGYDDEAVAYTLSLPGWLYALWFVGGWGAFIGSLLLLLKKKLAVWVLGASLLGALGTMSYTLINPDQPESLDAGMLPYVIIIIAVALLCYAIWMKRRGILR